MVRTKQTARMATGGKAPRKQLPSKSYKSGRPLSTSVQVETWPSGDEFESPSEAESEELEGSEDESEKQAQKPDSKELHEHVLLTPLHLRKDPTVRREGRYLVLPMRFGSLKVMGKKSLRKEIIDATPDTGSRVNAITRDCLRAIGGKMKLPSAADDSVLLGNGDVLRAKGVVTLRCSFAQGAPGTLIRKFLVFDCLLPGIEVLLGRPFLAFTKTLTEYSNRLKEIAHLETLPRMMNMSLAGQGLRCYLDSVLTIAIADTGSDANLMKTDYAKQRKWDIKPVPVSKRYVLLPGDRIAQLSGSVQVRLDSVSKTSAASSSRATPVISANNRTIAHPNTASVTAHDSSSQGQSTGLVVTFYLLDKLIVDVLLGQLLLDTLDAFNAHTEGFVEFDVPEARSSNLLGIKWASRLAEKYRNLCHSASSPPRELLQVNAANEPRPDTSAITQFLGVSDISSLVDQTHFELCMKEQWFREAHRRQVQADGIEGSLAKLQAQGTLGPADAYQFRLTMQVDEDVARQAYEQGKKACRQAWEIWISWLKN